MFLASRANCVRSVVTLQAQGKKPSVSFQEHASHKKPLQGCCGCYPNDLPMQVSCHHSSHSVLPSNRGSFRGRGTSRNHFKQANRGSGHKRTASASTTPDVSSDVVFYTKYQAGHLAQSVDQWRQFGAPETILKMISRYRIPFRTLFMLECKKFSRHVT